MCGIAGLIEKTSDTPLEYGVLQRFGAALAHRGPDGENTWSGKGVGLVHRRLAVIDIEGGGQPMSSLGGALMLVFNGEIYNFRELRSDLKARGHHFETRSDSEVLLKSYEEWGEACVDYLRGMFAFAIWDDRRKSLFAARDRLGEKPFFWTSGAGRFVFASELDAVLQCRAVPRVLRSDAVEDYLALGYVPDPKTILQHVHKLAPGHCLKFHQGREAPEIRRYWRPDLSLTLSHEEAVEQFMDRLEGSVTQRMVADVPVGAFLSGGLDSSAVVALMSRHAESPIETCTIGFDEVEEDESGHALLIADHFLTRHRLRLMSHDESDLLDLMPKLFGEPFADSSALPSYRVAALAREKVKVALSGDGADELFAGYRRHYFHLRGDEMRAMLPPAFRRSVFGFLGNFYPRMTWAPSFLRAKSTFLELALDGAEAYFNSVAKIPAYLRKPLMGTALKSELNGYRPEQLFIDIAKEVKGADALTMARYIDLLTYLPGDILTKVDRTSMAHGLEVRAPFLDHKFVNYAFWVEPCAHIAGGRGKAVMREALDGLLPQETRDRTKKGFTVPLASWLRESLKPSLEAMIDKGRLSDMGLVDADNLKKLMERHQKGVENNEAPLWSLLMLERSLEHLKLS